MTESTTPPPSPPQDRENTTELVHRRRSVGAFITSKLRPTIDKLNERFKMLRYSVTIVSPGTPAGGRPILLVPFQPTAVVTAFVDELWKRIARQKLSLAPNTHIMTLHLDSETGGIIDYEDVLSDLVTDPKNEKLFAVFAQREDNGMPPAVSEGITMSTDSATPNGTSDTDILSVRIVTASTAKDKEACPVLRLSQSGTLRQLHDQIAGHLQIAPEFEEDAETYECNCKLANQLADGPSPPDQFLVVYSKSLVKRLRLSNTNETSLKQALHHHFGDDFETNKKVNLVGAEVQMHDPTKYKKSPVAAICSRQRHTPVHARTDIDETGQRRSKVLDLHTSELPIHPSSMNATLREAGLHALATNGTVDIFVVNRTTSGKTSASIGKSSIYRSRAHWEPDVLQSDRGMAMFLSSLRVFSSIVQDMRDDDKSQDAVLHAFDLLTKFPPALRTLYILIRGRTPTAADSAALSQAMFEMLNSFMPTAIIGTDRSRVFEGSRLFFGFVLEKARTLKLSESAETGTLPYLDSFQTSVVRDHRTTEALMHAVSTPNGLVESSLFEAFQDGGILAGSHLQTYMVKTNNDPTIARQAFLSGGSAAEVTAFSINRLNSDYRYRDAGNASAAVDFNELTELGHMAELCGRNKLAVHKPSQLASAVAPSLSFDRNAHLAVYTGEQPCGDPGRSSLLFRPKHGEESIDSAVVEQLIAPVLQRYEADGTAVFDAFGGAAIRRQQRPEEILMFCVDCSASMRQDTDFEEVNDGCPTFSQDSDAQAIVEAEFYNRASFDDMKECLCEYEGFIDMVAIVAGAEEWNRCDVVDQVLDILRTMLSSEIIKKSKDLEGRRQYSIGRYWARREIPELQAALDKVKTFWAGLKTCEEAVCDFLIYRATSAWQDISQRWTWSLGDSVPTAAPPHQISVLTADITELPDRLRCPISHTLMEDAATAADGHTYSHAAISHWFSIRRSSPMHGLELDDMSLNANQGICDAAARWIHGDGIPGRGDDTHSSKRLRSTNDIEVTFESRFGSFKRKISPSMVLKDLYKLAFRGMKGKYVVFQLSTECYGPLAPTPEATISTRHIRSGDHIHIRIAEDDPTSGTPTSSTVVNSEEMCLVKVFERMDSMLFGFWVKRDTTQTLVSVQWKYWRHRFQNSNHIYPSEKQVWTDLSHSGDTLMTGQPRHNSEKLSTFLTTVHCFGRLGDEKVYQEDSTVARGSDSGQPMVLKVKLEGPWRRNRERGKLTRLDVLKQMFEALINRMLAYNYRTHVGLITFATTPKVAMGISHVLENFRRTTGDMDAEGDTALWEALALANDQLVEYGKKYPEAKKRIICISDGLDTKSASTGSQDVCWRLKRAEIAVDSVCLGDESNLELRTISHLLGCYRFHPTSLVNALAICEMEPFLSLTERPPISAPPRTPRHRLQFMGHFWQARYAAEPTLVTNDDVPPRKEHPNLRDEFVQLKAITARPGNVANSGNARSNLRISRLMTEMRLIVGNGAHPKYDIYVSETDMSFWKVVMDGPDESPYSAGTFLLYLHADDGYPTFAPKARFITKIKHPNVNAHGRICHSIFDRDWTSDINMTTLLDTVYGLLYQPEHSDPVNTAITLGFHHDQVEFAEEVREHVGRFAGKTRAGWKRELLGENEDEEMES